MKKQRVARFPGAEGRIPNFIGAEACAKQLAETPYWKAARFLKVNPDSPQRAIRQRALADGKIIYMAVPRLRSEKPFIELDPKKLKCSPYAASSIKGASQYGRPVTLDEVKRIDLVVCGSVAVNRARRAGRQRRRLLRPGIRPPDPGKKDRPPNTDRDFGSSLCRLSTRRFPMTAHDIPLSAIVTPTEVIEVAAPWPRPKGIYWNMLPPEKIDEIPVLKRSLE